MRKQKVLFVCVHNSARSVMAEALLNHLCGDKYEAESAGLTPGIINLFALQSLREIGLDMSHKRPRSAFDAIKSGTWFAHVITVCDDETAERCPIFPGVTQRHHWSFPDPSKFEGADEEKLRRTREVRDLIEAKIRSWCEDCH